MESGAAATSLTHPDFEYIKYYQVLQLCCSSVASATGRYTESGAAATSLTHPDFEYIKYYQVLQLCCSSVAFATGSYTESGGLKTRISAASLLHLCCSSVAALLQLSQHEVGCCGLYEAGCCGANTGFFVSLYVLCGSIKYCVSVLCCM